MDNAIIRFLCSLGGANIRLLRMCPTETGKFSGIGGAILFTGLLAALTGGFAFSKVTLISMDSRLLAVPFGLFWGLMILNLDRYIIITMVKEASGISILEILKAVFRFALAVLLAVVIAIPLELAIFNQEVQNKLPEYRFTEYGAIKKSAEAVHKDLVAEIDRLEAELRLVGDSRKRLREEMEEWDEKMRREMAGEREGRLPGRGEQFRRYKANYENAKRAFEYNDDEYQKIENELREKNASIHEKAGGDGQQEATSGLLAELRVFYQLVDENEEVEKLYWLLIVLMIVLETAPLSVKLLSRRGVYDDLVDLENLSTLRDFEKRTGVTLESVLPKKIQGRQKRADEAPVHLGSDSEQDRRHTDQGRNRFQQLPSVKRKTEEGASDGSREPETALELPATEILDAETDREQEADRPPSSAEQAVTPGGTTGVDEVRPEAEEEREVLAIEEDYAKEERHSIEDEPPSAAFFSGARRKLRQEARPGHAREPLGAEADRDSLALKRYRQFLERQSRRSSSEI